jgi:hypothetical protein
MKTKKTLKRLNKVVALLSNVIDQLPASSDGLRDLLDSAKANVVLAAKKVTAQASNGASKSKPPAKAETVRQGRLSAAGRKKISLAAKKRWEAARRKGVSAVTGRRLSKTA